MHRFTLLLLPVAFALMAAGLPSILQLRSGISGLHGLATLSTPTIISQPSDHEEYVVLLSSPHSSHIAEALSSVDLFHSHPMVHHIYNNSAFRGFTASLTAQQVSALTSQPSVAHIEPNSRVLSTLDVRPSAPWGLQRISSSGTITGDPSAVSYLYRYDDASLGAGVDIYIVDTGINAAHVAFAGRAREGPGFPFSNASDANGHGTHVAGTAGANIFGVASGANIIAVKVLDANGAGYVGDTLAGMDWVISTHEARQRDVGFIGSVMSMSWVVDANAPSPAVAAAIQNATAAGIHVAVAAGNAGADACSSSPGSSGGSGGPAVCVGSVGATDAVSSFSNTGACVDVFAPGENVLSTWYTGTNILQVLSGTSMATPHVAGLMAYLMLQRSDVAGNPAQMKTVLGEMAGLGTTGVKVLNNGVNGTAS